MKPGHKQQDALLHFLVIISIKIRFKYEKNSTPTFYLVVYLYLLPDLEIFTWTYEGDFNAISYPIFRFFYQYLSKRCPLYHLMAFPLIS